MRSLLESCEVVEVYDSRHPLGRGYVDLCCGEKRYRIWVHGDWPGGQSYVKLE